MVLHHILEVIHDEVTSAVKRARKHALTQAYVIFRMQQGDIIIDVQKLFTCSKKDKLNINVLKCLYRSWKLKVAAISKSKGF